MKVKLEKLRAKAVEKVSRKIASLEKQAEQMRAALESKQAHQMRKLRMRQLISISCFLVIFANDYLDKASTQIAWLMWISHYLPNKHDMEDSNK